MPQGGPKVLFFALYILLDMAVCIALDIFPSIAATITLILSARYIPFQNVRSNFPCQLFRNRCIRHPISLASKLKEW